MLAEEFWVYKERGQPWNSWLPGIRYMVMHFMHTGI